MKSELTRKLAVNIAAALVLSAFIGACSNSESNTPSSDTSVVTVGADVLAARAALTAPYTSDPFSTLQRFGGAKLTPAAQEYWDIFTPDMDPSIQCLPGNLGREIFSPAGINIIVNDDGTVTLSQETVYMDAKFPPEYAMDKRESWPVSDLGYSIGYWEGDELNVETRGVVERDILIGHIPILPSAQVIYKRNFKLIPVDQRWEARRLAPQEANVFLIPDDTAKTVEMIVWLEDPKTLSEPWRAVKQYREINDVKHVATAGDLPISEGAGAKWEGTEAAKNSGVPEEFLANYDGGCVLFPEYDESGENELSAIIPQ